MKLKIKVKKIKIRTEYIQLDAFLKFCGEAMSGGEAKEMILSENVLVNGEVCTVRGKKLRNGDKVSVNGRLFEVENESNFA